MVDQTTLCIAARVRERRERLGLSREELARALGVGVKNFGHKETGRVGITATELSILAPLLRAPVGYFYGEITESEAENEEFIRDFKRRSPEQQDALRRMSKAMFGEEKTLVTTG